MPSAVFLAWVFVGTTAPLVSAQQGGLSRPVIGGRVVDEGRQPVAGVTVRLIDSSHPGLPCDLHSAFPLQPRTYRETTTDSKGRFRFAVRHGDRAALQALKTNGDGADHLMSLVSDPVPSGEHVTITVWSTRVVHGVCRDRVTKRPLSKHPVHVVVPIGNGGNADETHALRLSTRTDSDGRYRVRVPLGTWVKVGTTGPGCLVECFVH
ncbi:MAG: carboxypeptidase-like regulatory domain-containing protein, partial [Planctomycetota bacterium]